MQNATNPSFPGTFYGHFESAWESADEKKAGAEAGVGWQIWLKCHYLRILAKCRDLRALSHFGKMSRFTHISRQKN